MERQAQTSSKVGFNRKQRSEGQRRVPATPQKFFALPLDKPFQETDPSLGQAYEPTLRLQRSSTDVDLDRSQDRSVHRAL
jgi:hypothetical protein